MIGITPVFHALAGGPLRLVGTGGLAAAMGFARASAATALGADGTTLQSFASNAPRLQGTAQRLLVEGARTNFVLNSRFGGAVNGIVGSGGVFPTGFGFSGTATREIVGSGVEDGLPYVDFRIAGDTAASYLNLTGNLSGAAAGQQWVASLFARLVGGSTTGLVGVTLELIERSSAGAFLISSTLELRTLVSNAALRTQRYALSRTYDNAGTALHNLRLGLRTTGPAYDITLRLSVPQLEQGAFASTPMISPAGTTGSATARAADAPTLALTASQQQRGTLVGTFMLPQLAPAGSEQGLLQLDSGADTNRILLRNAAGGGAVEAVLTSGGSTVATLPGGTVTAGTPFRAALGWSSSGVAICVNGGAVQSNASLPAGLTRLLLGHATAALTRAAFGEMGSLDLHPTRLPDSSLQALTTLS